MQGQGGKTLACDLDELVPLAYEELRRVARQNLSAQPPYASLTPTDLVNEVLLRLLRRNQQDYNDLDHLISVASLAMHSVLVDRARRRLAAKRGGETTRVPLTDDLLIEEPASDMISFSDACERLRHHSEAHFELLLLRIYAGLTVDQIAARRKQSTRTVERQWAYIKAILREQMELDSATKCDQ